MDNPTGAAVIHGVKLCKTRDRAGVGGLLVHLSSAAISIEQRKWVLVGASCQNFFPDKDLQDIYFQSAMADPFFNPAP